MIGSVLEVLHRLTWACPSALTYQMAYLCWYCRFVGFVYCWRARVWVLSFFFFPRMFIRNKKHLFVFLEAVFTVRRSELMHGWKGSFICLDRCFNASSTLAIPCAFMSSVCVCVCVRVHVCLRPLPCKVHVPVCDCASLRELKERVLFL